MNQASAMSPEPLRQSDELPTIEVVPRDGRLMWRVCGAGMCVEELLLTKAWSEFEALCRSKGIEPPRGGPGQPRRGPSEVDEPGV